MKQYINPQKKLYQHMDRLSALKAGKNPSPVNVEIDLSNRCSRGCHYCAFGYTHTRGPLAGTAALTGVESTGDFLDSTLAVTLVADLEFYGIRSVTWTGGGEPTLHPDFDLIVQCTRVNQGLYTHGGHIDGIRAALLKEYCQWVYVSLDYANAEDYARGKGVEQKAFHESCRGVQRLVAVSGNATIGLGFLLNGENHHQIGQMLELGWDLGVDYIQFRPMIQRDWPKASPNVDSLAWIDSLFLGRLEQLDSRPGVIADAERFRMYRDWTEHGYECCWWSGLQAVITPDGRVWACVNKRGFPEAALGNLHEENFADIWGRSPIQRVNRCRVLCRGHVPNLALQPMMEEVPHKNFI